MKKKQLFVTFLAGLLIGHKGVNWITHIFYITIILSLILKVFGVY